MLESSKEEFSKRRSTLMLAIGSGKVGLIWAAEEVYRNADTHYPYRQDSDFYYLTGLCEPQAMALFIPGRAEGEFILFVRERNPVAEVWTGLRTGCLGAKQVYGADEAFPIEEQDLVLAQLLRGALGVYVPESERCNRGAYFLKQGIAPSALFDIGPLIHEQRLIKTDFELACMRRAAEVTVLAHQAAMRCCQPGLYEYELEAVLQHRFISEGCRFSAYPSIVGSGNNACTLHYVENTKRMKDGDLVLIDAGAECDYYAADVTRTFPVNGRFTPDQKILYALVLKTQLAVIACIQPGIRWEELEALAVEIIAKGLQALGIHVPYSTVYMHRVGHFLGLDVHDVGAYKPLGESRTLVSGMVLTVEPGIYIPQDLPGVDARWWGMGIRIEDDVLVTDKGSEVLTAALVKTVAEIETWMNPPS